MKNQELKVLFYLKKNDNGQSRTFPVMGRITVGHTVAQFSAKLKCPPNQWDEHNGRFKGKGTEVLRVNRAIEKINLSVHGHHKSLSDSGNIVTAEAVKNGFQGIASVQHTLLKFDAEHNEHFAKRVSVDWASNTLKKIENSLNHLTAFAREKYRVSDIPFTRLDVTFIRAFDQYLRVILSKKYATFDFHKTIDSSFLNNL